jgi:serine protease AprX
MSKSLLYFIIFMSAIPTFCLAQSNPRYLILYKDKANSPFSIDKPTDFLSARSVSRRTRQNISIAAQDLPVNPDYVAAVKQTGAEIIYSSRWFNGSLVEASAEQLVAIKKLAFYKGIELNLPVANLTSKSPGIERVAGIKEKFEATEDVDYGNMNAQLQLMEAPALHKKGFQGENMLIAILDNGFNNGDEVGFFKQLRDEKRIIDTHDFVGRDGEVFRDGSHGLAVLSTIAANQPGTMIGRCI